MLRNTDRDPPHTPLDGTAPDQNVPSALFDVT